jgi:GTP:adenosylcobinamide-phosphate guanylyltransferase
MAEPIASMVIPAHNEGQTIQRCLQGLLSGAHPHEVDVVVVANACTDDTARVAREAGVRVIETDTPGKVNALRLGDAECQRFPRLYLDADVEVGIDTVRSIVKAFEEEGVLACAPALHLDLTGTGRIVRRVHRVHAALIAPHRALAGVGLYALDERGHARVFPLPDVIADDEYIHRSFAPAERRVVHSASSVVRPAPTVRAHLARRGRVRLGNHQLDQMGHPAPSGRLQAAPLRKLVHDGDTSVWDVLCYLAVTAVDRARFALRSPAPQSAAWVSPRGDRTASVPRSR